MASTYAYALVGGLLATFTVSPALAAPAAAREGGEPRRRACAHCAAATTALRAAVLAHRRAAAGRAAWAPVRSPSWPAARSALEFLPKLEEGNMWIRAVMPASISLEAGNDYANRMRAR